MMYSIPSICKAPYVKHPCRARAQNTRARARGGRMHAFLGHGGKGTHVRNDVFYEKWN